MTTKRRTLAEREAETLQATAPSVDEPTPDSTDATPSATRRKKPPTPKSAGVISKPKVTEWPQIAARVSPEMRDSYVALVNSGTFGSGRDVVTRALELVLLEVEPFDEFTTQLHEREKTRRRRR